jgi:hypothetical protein
MELGMGNLQVRLGHLPLPIEQNINVDGPIAVIAMVWGPTQLLLDALANGQELSWRTVASAGDCRIEEWGRARGTVYGC